MTVLPEFLNNAEGAAAAALAPPVDPADAASDPAVSAANPTPPDLVAPAATSTKKPRTWTKSQEAESAEADIVVDTTWHGRQASNIGKTCKVTQAPHDDAVRGSKRVEVVHPTGRHSHPTVRSFLSDFARDPDDQQPPGVLSPVTASTTSAPAGGTEPYLVTATTLASAIKAMVDVLDNDGARDRDARWLEAVGRTLPSLSALARTITLNLGETRISLTGKIPVEILDALWPQPTALAGIANILVYRGQIRLGTTEPTRVVIADYSTGASDRYHVKAASRHANGDLSTPEGIEAAVDNSFMAWLTREEIVARWPTEETPQRWAPAPTFKANLPIGQFRLGDALHIARVVIAAFDPASALYTLASGTSNREHDIVWRSSPITEEGIIDGWPTVDADQTDHFKIEEGQIRLGNPETFYEGATFKVLAVDPGEDGVREGEFLLHHLGPLEKMISDTWLVREKLLYLAPKIGGADHEMSAISAWHAAPAPAPALATQPAVVDSAIPASPAQIKDGILVVLGGSRDHAEPVAGTVQEVVQRTGASAYDVLVWGDNLITRGEIHLSRKGDVTYWSLGSAPVPAATTGISPSDTLLSFLTEEERDKLRFLASEYSSMLTDCGIEGALVTPLAIVRRIIRGLRKAIE